MADKIWFIKKGNKPIAAFSSKREAIEEYEELADDEDLYKLYKIFIDDIEDFEAEMDLAQEEGLI